ncbi:tetraacyldisaccharide 4'-kinase, partial [Helicobacter pylori]|nr:tetraacyldisaccharide 4'-kinase [Helicobacter pylori]
KEVVKKLYFRDHAPFDLELLEKEFYQNNATSLLVTSKDRVKLPMLIMGILKSCFLAVFRLRVAMP